MKKLILLLFTFSIFCSSCNNDDDNGTPVQEYIIKEANSSNISGTVFFVGRSWANDVFFIDIQLMDTNLDESYTAYLYNNSLSDGGDIVLPLTNFIEFENSDWILSSTHFDSLNEFIIEDKVLNYQDLLAFNGHIKIFNSNDPPMLVAEVNIGSNAE